MIPSAPVPLAPKEVAALLGVSARTATRLMSTGEIRSFRVGPKLLRCLPAAVEAYRRRPLQGYARERDGNGITRS